MREGSIYAIIYAILWLVFFLLLLRNRKQNTVSILVTSFYVLYSVLAVFLYNNEFYGVDFNTIKLFPYIYLFLMIFLSLKPILQFDRSQVEILIRPNTIVVNCFVCVFIILAIILLPSSISELRMGILKIMFDSSGGADLYREAHGGGVVQRTIRDIPMFIFYMFSNISVLLFFYYLTLPRLRRLILLGLSITILYNILRPISLGLRTDAIMTIFSILAGYVIMHKWIPKIRRKYINIIGLSIGGLILTLLMALTISRFSERDGGAGGVNLSYVAQASLNFNNYGLDAGGIRYGDRTCRIFKELLGFKNVPDGIVERRNLYYNMKMNDSVFYTFVGDFTLDFGAFATVFIFLFYALTFTRITHIRNGTISFSKLIIIYLAVLIPLQGGMYLFTFSDGGNYSLIAFAFSAVLFHFSDINQKKITIQSN